MLALRFRDVVEGDVETWLSGALQPGTYLNPRTVRMPGSSRRLSHGAHADFAKPVRGLNPWTSRRRDVNVRACFATPPIAPTEGCRELVPAPRKGRHPQTSSSAAAFLVR